MCQEDLMVFWALCTTIWAINRLLFSPGFRTAISVKSLARHWQDAIDAAKVKPRPGERIGLFIIEAWHCEQDLFISKDLEQSPSFSESWWKKKRSRTWCEILGRIPLWLLNEAPFIVFQKKSENWKMAPCLRAWAVLITLSTHNG